MNKPHFHKHFPLHHMTVHRLSHQSSQHITATALFQSIYLSNSIKRRLWFVSTPSIERKCLIQHNLAYSNRSRGTAECLWQTTCASTHSPSVMSLIGQFPYLLHLKPAQLAALARKGCQHPKRAGRTNDDSKKCSSHNKVCKPKPYCPVTVLSYHSPHTRWRVSKEEDLWIIQNQSIPAWSTTRQSAQLLPQPNTDWLSEHCKPRKHKQSGRRNAFIFSS